MPGAERVEVTVDGQPFTAYVWPERLAKPVLYPIRTARGTLVTRGFPLDPRPGERVDHPHHVGLWFNYGDVNGVDFWNNSEALAPAEQAKMGRILHRRVVSASSGRGQGELVVAADWRMPDGSTALAERTRFVFRADARSARHRARHRARGGQARRCASPTTRKACSACAWRARSRSRPTSRRCSRTPRESPRRCPCWTMPASTASTRAARASRAPRCGARAAAGWRSRARSGTRTSCC